MVSPAIFCVVVSKRPVLNSSHTQRSTRERYGSQRWHIWNRRVLFAAEGHIQKLPCLYCLVLFIHLCVKGFWVTAKLRPAVFTSALQACLCSMLFQSSWTMSLRPRAAHSTAGGWVGACVPAWGQRENPTLSPVCYSFIGFDCYSFTSCFNRITWQKPSVNFRPVCGWGFKAPMLSASLYSCHGRTRSIYAKRLYII